MTYQEYLKKRAGVAEKKVPHFLRWVALYREYEKKEKQNASLTGFERSLVAQYQNWQINQAVEAVKHYIFYNLNCRDSRLKDNKDDSQSWISIKQAMKDMLRLKHLSYQTEKNYLHWVTSFSEYTRGINPESLKDTQLKNYLTHLAVEKKVSISTQHQAFCALLFLYRYVLDKPVENLQDAIRSKKTTRLPVVLEKAEIQTIIMMLNHPYSLMASLIYGGGLRLDECLSLRKTNRG